MENPMEGPKQFVTDSLVKCLRDRIDPAVPPKSSDGQRLSTMSTDYSALLQPMTIEEARKLVRRLLAGYPNLGAHDPEGYIIVLTEIMSGYPAWAGQRTILKVDEENAQFPPTGATLRKWLDEAIGPYKFAMEWDARSAKQLEERKEIESNQAPATNEQQNPSYVNYDEAVAKHGRPTGVFEADRQIPYKA